MVSEPTLESPENNESKQLSRSVIDSVNKSALDRSARLETSLPKMNTNETKKGQALTNRISFKQGKLKITNLWLNFIFHCTPLHNALRLSNNLSNWLICELLITSRHTLVTITAALKRSSDLNMETIFILNCTQILYYWVLLKGQKYDFHWLFLFTEEIDILFNWEDFPISFVAEEQD